MATLTLAAPINVPNVRFVSSVGRVLIDPDTGELVATLLVSLAGALPYATLQVRVTNGAADGIRAKASPTGPTDAVEAFNISGAGVASAFTACLAAFQAGGRIQLLQQLQTLGLLPAGAIA